MEEKKDKEELGYEVESTKEEKPAPKVINTAGANAKQYPTAEEKARKSVWNKAHNAAQQSIAYGGSPLNLLMRSRVDTGKVSVAEAAEMLARSEADKAVELYETDLRRAADAVLHPAPTFDYFTGGENNILYGEINSKPNEFRKEAFFSELCRFGAEKKFQFENAADEIRLVAGSTAFLHLVGNKMFHIQLSNRIAPNKFEVRKK